MRTGTLTMSSRSGYLIIARTLSSSSSAFAARSKFSIATVYAFCSTFVAVANMANLSWNSDWEIPYTGNHNPDHAPRQRGGCLGGAGALACAGPPGPVLRIPDLKGFATSRDYLSGPVVEIWLEEAGSTTILEPGPNVYEPARSVHS